MTWPTAFLCLLTFALGIVTGWCFCNASRHAYRERFAPGVQEGGSC